MANTQGNNEEENYKPALAKAMQWCASDEYCLWDVKQKLARLGCVSSDISRILEFLTAEDFINEKRYALAFAKGKFNLFKWGKIKITSALRMKRIPEQFIGNALESLDNDSYRDTLIALLARKKRELSEETPTVMKRKLLRFAMQKGYEAEMVYPLLQMRDEYADD